MVGTKRVNHRNKFTNGKLVTLGGCWINDTITIAIEIGSPLDCDDYFSISIIPIPIPISENRSYSYSYSCYSYY